MLGFDVKPHGTCNLLVPPEVNTQPRGVDLPISAVAFLSQSEGSKRLVSITFQSPQLRLDRHGIQSMVSMEMSSAVARELAAYIYTAAEEADQLP